METAEAKKRKKTLEEKRRKEILSSAKKLFYSNGFSGTSMGAIAADAGISKGLIYHYFKNKEELLLSFSGEVDEYLRTLREEKNPYRALIQFGTDFLVNEEEKYPEAPPIQILLITFANQEINIEQHAAYNPILYDFGRTYLGDFFRRGIEQKIFRTGDAEEFGDIYWSFLMGKLLPVKKGRESLNAGVYVREILSVFEERPE